MTHHLIHGRRLVRIYKECGMLLKKPVEMNFSCLVKISGRLFFRIDFETKYTFRIFFCNLLNLDENDKILVNIQKMTAN